MSAGGASAQDASPGSTPLSEDRVKVSIGPDACVVLDGEECALGSQAAESEDEGATVRGSRKRRRGGSVDGAGEWVVRRGQWRLRVQPRVGGAVRVSTSSEGGTPLEIVLHAVKLDAVSGQRGRNMMRGFLTAGSP